MSFTFDQYRSRYASALGIETDKPMGPLEATIKAYKTSGQHCVFVYITNPTADRIHTARVYASEPLPSDVTPEAFDTSITRYLNMRNDPPTFLVDKSEFGHAFTHSVAISVSTLTRVISECVARDILDIDDDETCKRCIRKESLGAMFAWFSDSPVMALHITRDQRKYRFGGVEFLLTKEEMECL